jgi:hypothetical protein
MNAAYAQCININGQQVCGPANFMGGATDITIGFLISTVLGFIMPLSGILLFVFLVWGGYDLLLSQGNPEKVKSGKAKITNALIGFFLLIFSFLIVRLLSTILNLETGIL